MKPKTTFITLLLVAASLMLAGCNSGQGPLLINTSGQTIRLVVHASDGSTYDGECEDQSAAWAGKSKLTVSTIEIFMGDTRFELSGDELSVPFGKDGTTAFIVENTGPRKLALDEAKILMRGK